MLLYIYEQFGLRREEGNTISLLPSLLPPFSCCLASYMTLVLLFIYISLNSAVLSFVRDPHHHIFFWWNQGQSRVATIAELPAHFSSTTLQSRKAVRSIEIFLYYSRLHAYFPLPWFSSILIFLPFASRESFSAVANWLSDARSYASPDIVVVLDGNKKDLEVQPLGFHIFHINFSILSFSSPSLPPCVSIPSTGHFCLHF